MKPFVSGDDLEALLQHALGPQTLLDHFEVANQQHDYIVLIAQLRQPNLQVVVKLAGPQAKMASAFDRTAMIHRLVSAQTNIPMPETLAVNMDFGQWPWRYLIRTHTAGTPWSEVWRQLNADALTRAFREIGSAVAQLHAIRFQSWGELRADGKVTGPGTYLDALGSHAEKIIAQPRLKALFFEALEKNRELFLDSPPACLCHEDLHHDNILFHHQRGRWRLSTILDFDKAWAGSPETDLARLEFWDGMTHPAFWKAYQDTHGLDAAYAERRPIYQLLWCFEFGRATPRHLADTRQLCERLGLSGFDGFE